MWKNRAAAPLPFALVLGWRIQRRFLDLQSHTSFELSRCLG